MTNYQYWLLIASSGWSFVFAIPSQMTHLVASITLDSARIRLEGFMSSVLLWLVIIIVVVGVGVMVVVVESSSVSQTFVCDHLILAPECALLPDPLASGL
ncbi:hypothetical protein Tco_0297518 [Tanacetum coccineum]